MKNIKRKIFKLLFSCICVIAAIFMVGYWVYKYKIEDREVGVVDYINLETANDVHFPTVSVCLENPILEHKLNETNPDINGKSYMDFLKAKTYNESYKSVDYNNVTINLDDYFLYGDGQSNNQTDYHNTTSANKHIFSGFYHGEFVKCFAVTTTEKNSHSMYRFRFFYDKEKLYNDLSLSSNTKRPTMRFNLFYPNQFLLKISETKHYDWDERVNGIRAWIKSMELLKRRNTIKKKCTPGTTLFDDLVLKKHIETVGCRAPYHTQFEHFPLCNSQKKMKKARYEFLEARKKYYPKTCQRISKIDYQIVGGMATNRRENKLFAISTIYPEDVKIITQAKAVDVHTLLGNIGGYVGLFLGKWIILFRCQILLFK